MMFNIRYLTLCLSILLVLPLLAQQGMRTLEAEELTKGAKIIGGGDLLIIRAPDPARLPLHGERALTFVPVGKGSTLELRLPVEKDGIYILRLHTVIGPSCGIYNMMQDEDVKSYLNQHHPQTMASDKNAGSSYGFVSKRMVFKAGENVVRFVYQGTQGRMGNLVLDYIQVTPFVRQPRNFVFTKYDAELPAGEKLSPNMLKNPGFEEFLPEDRYRTLNQLLRAWSLNTVAPKETEIIVRDKALAHSGTQAICLAPDPLEDNTVLYQSIPMLESGHTYRITFYARGTGSMQSVVYQRAPAKAADTLNGDCYFQMTDAWQRFSYRFSPSASGKVMGAALALYAWDDGKVYIDDVSVQEILP